MEPDDGFAEEDEAESEDALVGGLAQLIEKRMILAWVAIRERLRAALATGEHEPLVGALSPELYAEVVPRLEKLPLVDVDEEAPRLQLLDVRLEEERFVYSVREESRSGLGALLLDDEGLLEAELSMGEDWLFRLDVLVAAAEPREGARTVDVAAVGVESLLPGDFAPPRYRVEPQGGEGTFCGVSELEQALGLAESLSAFGDCYRVYDRESLERRGALVARFQGGQRL